MPPDATKPVEMRDTLNEIAHAMCVVVPVYARNSTSGLPLEIPLADLVTGRFIRGAHRLVTETGVEYEGLTVQRRDIPTAIQLLKRIGFGAKRPA
jgi:hypothetical protein